MSPFSKDEIRIVAAVINYFKERWNLDEWSDYARYSVYDDVPWDEFKDLNYLKKKRLLTQNGKMNVRK